MAKPRVHELAKELGITSKEAISTLQSLGEFVRGASSTVEPPVAKKLRSAFAGKAERAAESKPASAPKPGTKPAPKPATGARPGAGTKPGAPAPGPAAPKPADKPA
ncbi:translation initiation factor IF-2 N-terminal domain-containing protein, partial [Kocuria flava]